MGRTWKKNNFSLQAKNPSFNIKIPVKIVQASKNSKKYQATVASTSVCTIPDLCALTFWILLEISISQSRPMESETNNKTFWVLIHTKQSNIYSYFFHFTIFQIDNWHEIECCRNKSGEANKSMDHFPASPHHLPQITKV